MWSQKKFSPLKKSCPIRRNLLENKILEEEKGDTQLFSLTVPKQMRFMKRKRKEKREKRKKVDRLSQKSKKMKKVYAQDKKVVKEKIQRKKAKEKSDRTLRSSKKNREQSSVSDTFCIICLEPYSESAPGEIWRRCIICKSWAHKCCVTSSIRFKCPNCQQLD